MAHEQLSRAEWKVERAYSGFGEPENRHGDDLANDQLREGSSGRFHRSLHGDRYRHRRSKENRHNITHRISR